MHSIKYNFFKHYVYNKHSNYNRNPFIIIFFLITKSPKVIILLLVYISLPPCFYQYLLASATTTLIGAVVGGAVGVLLVIVVVIFVVRSKRSKVNQDRHAMHAQPVALPATSLSPQYNTSTMTSIKPIWRTSEYDVEPRSQRAETVWTVDRPILRSSMYIPPTGSNDYVHADTAA